MTEIGVPKSRRESSRTRVARIQELVVQLGRLLEGCDAMCLAQLDVTVSQSYTLLSLPSTGEMTMSALSEAVGVAGSTGTRMVDQLVRKRYVVRFSDSEDRRVVRVALTSRGRQLREALATATDSCFLGAFADVPKERQLAAIEALELVNASLRETLRTDGCARCTGE